MTTSSSELHERLARAYALPRGPARFAALDALFRHADAAGDIPFAFSARMNAISDFHHGGDPTRAFLAFSWCLSVFDKQPEVVGRQYAHSLLWDFKWIVWALPQFPDIPLDRTMAVLDDMQRRYQLAGHSLHAVHQHRWLVAHHVGDMSAAQESYDRMLTAKRDTMSDCSACVPSGQVRHLTSLGRFEEAITVGEPFKRGGCSEQPQWMLSELLTPYLRTGRFDEAVEAHRDGYRRIRDDRHHLDNLAQHVLFCGLTGNEPRGLELVERHLNWLERPSSPYAAMEFAASAALVLGRLRASGRGDLVVSRRSDDGTRRWEATVAEVHDEVAQQARTIAARFDARNGNRHQSNRIEARMAAEPVTERLPLTVLAGRSADTTRATDPKLAALVERVAALTGAGDTAGAARARLDVAHALRNAGRWEDAVEAAEEAVRSLDRAGLRDDAIRCRYLLWELYRRAYHHKDSAQALLAQLSEMEHLPEGVPPLEVILEDAAGSTPGEQAVTHLLAAADRHRANGTAEAELRVSSRALVLLARRPPSEQAWTVLKRIDTLSSVAKQPPAEQAGNVQAAAARLLAAADRVDEALARLDMAVALFSPDELADERRAARLHRATLRLRAGDPVAAESEAREVLAEDPDEYGWSAGALLARALRAQGRPDEAAEVLAAHQIDADYLDEADDDED
ncbi:tetratricopeptide repeat protein [Micromonospora chaiyaphumensis]|uniref:Tetratricopeptide repeat-containing protein n=1 Tax=Micromonospora chaiyaphumensis TaxID=307119 RepID=A0A1C4ZIY5_9ACTN|nr:tetratricopeptide repeat protein [Micromonospora chaiyaphumensis]SCF33017.1 hypothetical protein GA0070214_11563 [Micromonospora chaiyaphumensis]